MSQINLLLQEYCCRIQEQLRCQEQVQFEVLIFKGRDQENKGSLVIASLTNAATAGANNASGISSNGEPGSSKKLTPGGSTEGSESGSGKVNSVLEVMIDCSGRLRLIVDFDFGF